MKETYHKEAIEIIRVVSMYKVLLIDQVAALFPHKLSQTIVGVVEDLAHSGRLYFDKKTGIVKVSKSEKDDDSIIRALWVLLDFLGNVSFHTASDYPVAISFFSQDELYEIYVVPYDTENLLNHAVWGMKIEDPAKAIVVIDDQTQIPKMRIPRTVGYCIVSEKGETIYFKTAKEVLCEQQTFDYLGE